MPSPCTRADIEGIVEYLVQQLKNQVAVNPSEKMYHPKIQDKRDEIRAEVMTIMTKLRYSCSPHPCTQEEMVEIVEDTLQQLKNQVAVKAN
jgi:hypothetical protein